MTDGLGRNIDYIRISVTDRCNLRCMYCMPKDGLPHVSHEDILRYEETERLVRIFSGLGISKIKLTGGEPLLMKNFSSLAAKIKSIPGIEQVTITTNGVNLEKYLNELFLANIDGINISLDTPDCDVYKHITGTDSLKNVMKGLNKALETEIPLKINCVPLGIEGQRETELAEIAKNHPVHVRYIEMMPIGLGRGFTYIPEEKILHELTVKYGEPHPAEEKIGNGPCHYYEFEGFKGKIGFISAISHKFCGECNRLRLTSQGFLKSCLQYDIGADLRSPLRNGATDEEIEDIIKEVIKSKPEGHMFSIKNPERAENKIMSSIGG